MPLYEYECEQCGARFEVIQRFSDHAIEACKTCGGPVHKLISAPAIHFKGTGWYITDYGKKNGSGEPAAPSPSSPGSDTKSETKGDAKADSSSASNASNSTSSSTSSSSSSSGGGPSGGSSSSGDKGNANRKD